MPKKKTVAVEIPESVEISPEGKPQMVFCIAAYNSAATIAKCLQSVKPYADRIVVVEGRFADNRAGVGPLRSSDETIEIAKELDAEVIEAPAGMTQPRVRDSYLVGKPGDWYFVIDSDEVLTGDFPKAAIMAGKPISYQIVIRGPLSWSPYPVPTIRAYRHIGERPTHNPGQLLIDGEGHLMDATHPDGFGGILEGCWLEHLKG